MAVDIQNGTPAAITLPEAMDISPAPPSAPTYNFTFADFLRKEYRYGLDPTRPICKAYLAGHCPLGNSCPDKHQPPQNTFQSSLVCKHWLRGLCKKGDACEFLHEYNLRKMPECNYWSRYGTCSNGDECLYLHPDPESKRPPCAWYERGFCPLGPRCADKHIKKEKLCPFYMAGFCPDGLECKNGAHAKYIEDLKKPEVKIIKSAEQLEQEKLEREAKREEAEAEERERFPDGQRGQRGGRQWQRRGGQKRQKRGGF